jgi:valyl-tRNA synthetase
VVATTRPETMLGDVAVMVHPEDERYTHLIGKQVRLPLTGRQIPVIADDYVDRPSAPAWSRSRPRTTERLPGRPAPRPADADHLRPGSQGQQRRGGRGRPPMGLDRFAARKQIVADLEAEGLLVEVKKHKLMVPRCARTGQVIEPMLTDQWFVAMTKPAPAARASPRRPSRPWLRAT